MLDGGTTDGGLPDGMVTTDGETSDVVGTDDGAAAADAGPDADAEATDACAATCPATASTDTTFGPVLFGDGTVACPTGFDSSDVIENPTAKAGSCTCGACKIAASCNAGSVDSIDGNSATTCASDTFTFQLNDGGCNNINAQWGTNYATVTTPTAKNVSCTAAGAASTPTSDQYTKTVHRVCAPQAATCSGSLCRLDAGAFRLCLGTLGTNACPSGFPVRHVVGKESAVTLACPDCACTNPTATCSGTFTYYSSNGCTGSAHPIAAGTCTSVGKDSYNSYKWQGTVAPGTCTTTPASTATLTMPTAAIVCCPN